MTRLQAATDTFKELVVMYVGLLSVAAGVFCLTEGTSLADSFYWAATTATSTGYGDLSPKTALGKLDAVLLMHASIFFIAPMVIVRLISKLDVNRDVFSHEEQVALMAEVTALRLAAERDDRDAFIAGWWVNAAEPDQPDTGSRDYFDGCAQLDYEEWKRT